ncbi:MAG: AAA family ATPase, partial [Acidobacteria bacterium]|nr:AAA family ATPase [Acidobacteriota bacterium]
THENLVMLYELMSDGEQWYFTMELIDGVNLMEYVRERSDPGHRASEPDYSTTPTLDVESAPGIAEMEEGAAGHSGRSLQPRAPWYLDRVRDAFTQLADGICALHHAGMLHRDIKPSNVLVNKDGRVVLLDFGLVAELAPQDLTQSVNIVGTPSYMSPEQGAGAPIMEASDWYSVGVMLYETLTGHLPFTGRLLEVLANKQKYEPPPPVNLVPGLPDDLNSLCRDLLRRDPAARPTGPEVLRRFGGDVAEAHRVSAARGLRAAPLVGRERHMSALMDAFAATKQGRAVTVYIHGRSGMGKSALMRRFLEDLRRTERQVVPLSGRCYERESVPYKALDSLVDSLSQHLRRLPQPDVERLLPRDVLALARLFPVLREVEAVASARRRAVEIPDSQELRRRAFAALRELLARMAEETPVVLFIDDLQWGDLDSAALLGELLRPPDPPAVLLIGCYRSEEADSSPLLRALLPSRGAGSGLDVREMVVGELTQEEAEEVARALLGDDRPATRARAEAIARESGGNPFFLDELVHYTRAGRESEGETTLDEVLRVRVARLPEEARRLLEVVAVAARPVELEVARRAAGLDAEQHSAVSVLRVGHLVRTVGKPDLDEIETYHDRIREAVVAHLPGDVLTSHHHRLASAWEATGHADPETLAVHLQAAGEAERAARFAAQAAARAAEALAFDRAARLYRMALELRPVEGAEARALRVQLGDALANAGRGAEAAEAYLAAVPGAGAAEALELDRRAAEQLLYSGHIDQGLQTMRTVLGLVGMKLAPSPARAVLSFLLLRARLRLRGLKFQEREAGQIPVYDLMHIDTCWSVAVGLGMVDTIRAAEFQARHLLLALEAGEPYRVARALAMEVGYSSHAGSKGLRRTQELLQTTMALAERVSHPHALALATVNAGIAAHLQGYFPKAFELFERAEVIMRERCKGVAWELDSTQIFYLNELFWLGEWNELGRRLLRLIEQAQDRGDLYAASYMRTRSLYLLDLVADRPEKAREEQGRAMEGWSQQGFHIQHYWDLVARTEIDLYTGETRAAWSRIEERWPAFSRSLLTRVQALLIESRHLRARAALAEGSEKRLRLAERDAKKLEGEKAECGVALAGLIRAGVTAARGDRQRAITLLAAAEQALDKLSLRIYAAAARYRRGQLLADEEGRALVAAAASLLEKQNVQNVPRMMDMLAPGKWT